MGRCSCSLRARRHSMEEAQRDGTDGLSVCLDGRGGVDGRGGAARKGGGGVAFFAIGGGGGGGRGGGGGCVLCHRVREGGRKGQAAALCCARGVSGDAVFLYLDLIKELGS